MAGYLGREECDTKPYVFISYNTEDQKRISQIVSRLPQELNTWYDKGLKRVSEEEWQEQIAAHLRGSEIVLFFISRGIFSKADSFVRKEYDMAKRHSKRFCIVLLDDITTEMIPAKYDFWWGDIQNRQCILAGSLTPEQTAAHIAEECFELDAFTQAVQAQPEPTVQETPVPRPAVNPQPGRPAKRRISPLPFIGLGLVIIAFPFFIWPYISLPLTAAAIVISVICCRKRCRLYGFSVAGILLSVLMLLWTLLLLLTGVYSSYYGRSSQADTAVQKTDMSIAAVYDSDSGD